MRRINDVNYVIRRSPRHTPFTVHIDRIRPYYQPLNDDREIPSLRTHQARGREQQSTDYNAEGRVERPKRRIQLPSRLRQFKTN